MMDRLDKKNRLLVEIIIFVVLIALIGTSWAYFTKMVSGESKQNVIQSGSMILSFEDGPLVAKDGMIPGEFILKNFKVKNIGTLDTSYDLFFSELVNTFSDNNDLVYTVISDSGCSKVNETTVPSESGERLVSKCEIESGVEHTYTLKVSFKETNDNQNDNMGKTFNTKISVNEFKQSGEEETPFILGTVDELKSIAFNEGTYVNTRWYYSVNDGGAGKYLIESDNGQNIDNGRYIKLDNGNVAKLLIENKTINVRQYGAKGNGIDDDSSIIQTVSKQIKEDDCDTIYFPDGTYNLAHTIYIYEGTYTGSENSKILITGKDQEFASTVSSENAPTIYLENCKFVNSSLAFNTWYGNLNSSVSNNQVLTVYAKNTTFTKNNKNGSINYNAE